MSESTAAFASRWREAWPDLLAFGAGLAMAWQFQWQTRDLVWSLWLSSLLVGYAVIVWGLFAYPGVFIATWAWQKGAMFANEPKGRMALSCGAVLIVALLSLAVFTVHFGGFHYVYSVFLSWFLPLEPGTAGSFPGPALYWEVFQRYWWFVPAAVIAERTAFRFAPDQPGPPDISVKAADIAARKARNAAEDGCLVAPYRNVLRMHLLIFFFLFAHLARLEGFLIYAVVYAVYFFPWRLLKKDAAQPLAAA